jgi:hypothetical protein
MFRSVLVAVVVQRMPPLVGMALILSSIPLSIRWLPSVVRVEVWPLAMALAVPRLVARHRLGLILVAMVGVVVVPLSKKVPAVVALELVGQMALAPMAALEVEVIRALGVEVAVPRMAERQGPIQRQDQLMEVQEAQPMTAPLEV